MDESRLKEGTAIRRIREETLALLQGPRVQITFLYGVFGTPKGLDDEAQIKQVRTRQMGRMRLVITETGGTFEDLGFGRFCATLGADEPTEEDPLMAVTIGLKLLRLAGMVREAPPLRLVTVTGRVPQQVVSKPLLEEGKDPKEIKGHELLSLAHKLIRDCEPGTLYVDGYTARMIRDTHQCQRVKDLKGALSNVPVYKVSSGASVTNASFEPILCGRDKEVKLLNTAYQRVKQGEGPIFMTITGDLGTGKSRLLRSFVHEVEAEASIFKNPRERRRIDRWRRTPYSYFGEILRIHFEILDNEDPAVSRNKLVKGLHKTLSGHQKSELPLEMAHFVGVLCQIDFPDSPFLREESPAQLEHSAFMAFTHFLEQASQYKPIVFVLDDLYSADSSSLRLLNHLTQHLEPARLLCLCSSRTELLNELQSEGKLELPGERIVLHPLNRDDARHLILALLGDEIALPEPLLQRILAIAEGNPYFLREIIRSLTEQGLIQALEHGDTDNIEIPGNIEGILLSRISRLNPQEREILQKASIFGKSFWRGGLEMLFRQEADISPGWRLKEGDVLKRDDDLEQILEGLVTQGVIHHHSDSAFHGENQYNFTPSWLQELVYNEVPKELLAPYHRLVAMWLELQSQRRKGSDLHVEIAHHFDLGQEPHRAAPYHIEVGIRARKIFATERAIRHLEKGVQYLEESHIPKRMHALRELAEAYTLEGEYAWAIEQFEEILRLSWQMGDRVLAGEIFIRMGRVYYLMRDFQNALSNMKNGHTLHQEGGHQRGIAAALSNMGEVYLVVGDYQKARLYLQEALDLRRELNHPGDLSFALSNMGNLLIEQGELDLAMQYHQEALELRKSIGNPHLIIRSMNNIALIHMIQGSYDDALAELIVSAKMAQKIGEKLMMAVVTSNIGELYLLRGELEQAEKYLERAMQMAERIGDELIQAECFRLQGELLLEQERGLEALDCCGKAFQLVTARGILSAQSPIYRLMAEIYAALPPGQAQSAGEGNPYGLPSFLLGNALACYEESIALAHRHGNRREEARTRMLLGIYEVNQGNIPRGRYQLQCARDTFEQLRMESERVEINELIEEVDTHQHEKSAKQTPSSPPPPLPVSLRPARHKMAHVEKTMAFRVSFDESEIGPAPTPADAPTSEPTPLPQTNLPGGENPGALSQTGLPRASAPREHTLASLQAPSVYVTDDRSTKAHTLSSQKAISGHDNNAATVIHQAPPPKHITPTNQSKLPPPPPMIDATVKHKPPLASLLQQGVLKHAGGASSDQLPATPPQGPPLRPKTQEAVHSTRELKAPNDEAQASTPAQSKGKERKAQPLDADMELQEDDLMLETIPVVDLHLYTERGEQPSKPPTPKRPHGPSATQSIKPPQLDEQPSDTTKKTADDHPRIKPPQTDAIDDSDAIDASDAIDDINDINARTQKYAPPVVVPRKHTKTTGSAIDALPELNIPSRLTPPSDADSLPFLRPIKPMREPSVYDSQVIIAQVAEDDDISRDWFEEGRSDRTKQFWEKHKEQRDAVKEDLLHERVIKEIDKLDTPSKKKK